MSDEEYKNYLKKEIEDFIGENEIKKIKYATGFKLELTNKYEFDKSNYNLHFHLTTGSGYLDYENISVAVRNKKIVSARCSCFDFYRKDKCKHVAMVLYFGSKVILPKPLSKKEISHNILELFKSNTNKQTGIKEKMNLLVELDLYSCTIKLHIGLSKTYVLNSDNKFRRFLDAYKRETYEFGKKFTYDPKLHYFDREDEELFNFLAAYDKYSSPLQLNERELNSLLSRLEHKKFILSGYGVINEISHNLPPIFELDKDDDNFKLSATLINNFYIPDVNTYNYAAYKDVLYILPNDIKRLFYELKDNEIDELVFEKEDLDLFKNGLLKSVKNNVSVLPSVDEIVIAAKPESKIYIDFNRDKIKAHLKFIYNNQEIDYFDSNTNIIRDEEEENSVVEELLSHQFAENKKDFELAELDSIGDFLDTGMLELSNKYEIFTSKKFDDVSLEKKKHITSMFSIGQDGIMSYSFDTGDIKVEELAGIFSSLKNKKRYYKLKSGNLLKLDDNEELNELSNVFTDLQLSTKNIEDGTIAVPKYRALYIDSLKNNKYGIISTDSSFDNFIEQFKKYKNVKIEFDKSDEGTLRDYQKVGVKWLYTLYKCDLGGILADEMGLGKSIQTISFIKQILKEKPDAKIMIVCPTSLVYNWKKEFDKFASNLKYVTVSDTKQKRHEIIQDFDKYNIFITTYGLIRNDNDEYEDKNFELCVIDEAQAIKNYQAGMTKEIKKIKARTKIALTGTPLENSVFELWSIFDFIMPGYLNNITAFRENYGIKDVDAESLERLTKLNYQIKPFILRRKKDEVSKDLPDKIENNIYLDLPEVQKSLYLKTLKETEEEINELIATGGYIKVRFKILQLLTKLRQICINPNIAYDNYKGEAVKIEKLTEIVKDLVLDGHKILIFSSFKTVIDSVKEIFDKEQISNYVIAGDVKSKTRMDLVEKFNNDNTKCFLITLKSGGTGLNLVGADVVIHLDIWWNPQAENQATDRAHRIGQTKNVTVIKLITRGTIEEKIMELQEKKRILSENLIEGKNNSETLSSLSEEEMKELLTYNQEDE